jgi:hypothetical protein
MSIYRKYAESKKLFNNTHNESDSEDEGRREDQQPAGIHYYN